MLEEIDESDVKMSSKQIAELVDLLEKEAVIEEDVKGEISSEKEKEKLLSDEQVASATKAEEKPKITSILPETQSPLPPSEGVTKPNPKTKTL